MKDVVLRNLLIFLYLMYFSQGILYPSGLVSQVIIVVIVVICLYYFGKSCLLQKKKHSVFKLWTTLFFINVVYSVFTADFSNILHFENVKGVILTSVSFYPFYYFSTKGIKLRKAFAVFFLVSIPIAIFQFFLLRDQIILDSLNNLDSTEVVNNATYFMVLIMPFALFLKNKTLAGSLMLLLFYFIILGVKRETALTGGLSLIVFTYVNIREAKGLFANLAIVIVSLIVISFAVDFILDNHYLVERFTSSIQTKDSSGRDEIAQNIFNYWSSEGGLINLLFGYGFATSLVASKINSFAHNDWVEMLCNYGLFAVSIYALIFVSLINLARKSKEKEILFLVILLILIKTVLSMFYTSIESFVLVMIIATFVGKKLKEEIK